MNERIKELERKCWDHQTNHLNADLFAKLIVRCCLDNMENCDGDLDFAIWKTKQDFGVK